MTENPNQPGEYDAVLGGQAPLTADSAVLGGLAGVKQRLARGGVKQRIDALLDAFEYGQEGLELVIQALEDTSSEVCSAAYLLLQDSTEPRAKQALWEYNPYKHFKCLHTLEGHRECLLCLAISPDGKNLVSGCYDTVKVWDLRSGQLIHTFDLYRPCIGFRIVISPDFQTLVSDYEGQIEVWNLWTRQKIRTFNMDVDAVGSLAITPDGQTLICGGMRSGNYHLDLPIKMWNLHTGELVRTLHGHTRTVISVIISSDGQTLVSQTHRFFTKVWDLHTGQELNSFDMPPRPWIDSLAISSNGQKIVSGSRDGSIKIWDVLTDQIVQTFQGSSPGWVSHLDNTPYSTITPDGKILVAGGVNNTIKVWNVQTGQELCTLPGHSSPVKWIAINHDRQTIVSYNTDNTINVWGMP